LPKFLGVLSVSRPRQEFIEPIDVQVLFVIGLKSPQNKPAFIHLAVLQDPPSRDYFHGSKNHDLFVSERHHGIVARGAQGWVDCPDRGAEER